MKDLRVDVNCPTRKGITPFYAACFGGFCEVVRLFLEEPRAVEGLNKPRDNGATPLHVASKGTWK